MCVFMCFSFDSTGKTCFCLWNFSFICSNCGWLLFLQIFKLEMSVSTDGWGLTWSQLNFLAQHRSELEQRTFLLLVIVLLKRDLSECKNHRLKSVLTLDGLCAFGTVFWLLIWKLLNTKKNVHCIIYVYWHGCKRLSAQTTAFHVVQPIVLFLLRHPIAVAFQYHLNSIPESVRMANRLAQHTILS